MTALFTVVTAFCCHAAKTGIYVHLPDGSYMECSRQTSDLGVGGYSHTWTR